MLRSGFLAALLLLAAGAPDAGALEVLTGTLGKVARTHTVVIG